MPVSSEFWQDCSRRYFQSRRDYNNCIWNDHRGWFAQQSLNFRDRDYVDQIISLEKVLLACITHETVAEDEIAWAMQSVKSLVDESLRRPGEYLQFFLDTARWAISDLYYLLLSYYRYHHRDNMPDALNFGLLGAEMLSLLKSNYTRQQDIQHFLNYKRSIDRFFLQVSFGSGCKLNDQALKTICENPQEEGIVAPIVLRRLIDKSRMYKARMKKDYEFLREYSSERRGKQYRYDFIIRTMTKKISENAITYDIYKNFHCVRENFIEWKKDFDRKGLEEFGPAFFCYREQTEFLYKCSRMLEFIYLRTQQYDRLQELRGRVIYVLEREMSGFQV